MSKRKRLVDFLVGAVALGAITHLLIVFSPQASADEAAGPSLSDPTDQERPNPTLQGDWKRPESPPPRDFFAQYPAGKSAQSYEELSSDDNSSLDGATGDEREALDNAGLWAETDHGHAVHSRWSQAARTKRAKAKAKRAAQLAGTQGFDELGVF